MLLSSLPIMTLLLWLCQKITIATNIEDDKKSKIQIRKQNNLANQAYFRASPRTRTNGGFGAMIGFHIFILFFILSPKEYIHLPIL